MGLYGGAFRRSGGGGGFSPGGFSPTSLFDCALLTLKKSVIEQKQYV